MHQRKKIKWLPKPALHDLQLFHDVFLPKIHKGISLNLLTYRRPSHILFSDACPKGLGGYSLTSGCAWRWEIPPNYVDSVKTKNNLLEFLAAMVTIWVELTKESTPPLSCILASGDNTSAVGWLHNVNVDETNNKALHLTSRKLVTILMDTNCCLYSQHFKGEFNEVADSLSRRHDLADKELLSFILLHYPEQVPDTFVIDQLPPSITSWMIWLLQKNKDHMEFSSKLKTKKRERGTDGNLTLNALKTPTIPSCNNSNHSCGQVFLEPLAPPSAKGCFQEKIKNAWLVAQLKRPWQNWVRSSGQTWGQTPTMAQMDTQSTLSYKDRSRA
jgi:hypothetical protein